MKREKVISSYSFIVFEFFNWLFLRSLLSNSMHKRNFSNIEHSPISSKFLKYVLSSLVKRFSKENVSNRKLPFLSILVFKNQINSTHSCIMKTMGISNIWICLRPVLWSKSVTVLFSICVFISVSMKIVLVQVRKVRVFS